MRYYVGILHSTNSSETDVKHIVRGRSANDAIRAFVKAFDLHKVYAAYAYPIKAQHQGPNDGDWRRNIRCSVTGKVTMVVGVPLAMKMRQPKVL